MRFLYFPNHDWMKMHSHIYMQEAKVEVPILARKFAEVSLRILHFGLWCLVRAHNMPFSKLLGDGENTPLY